MKRDCWWGAQVISLTATIIVRFRLQRDAVPVLHQAIGPNYVRLPAQPGIGSLTRDLYETSQDRSPWHIIGT